MVLIWFCHVNHQKFMMQINPSFSNEKKIIFNVLGGPRIEKTSIWSCDLQRKNFRNKRKTRERSSNIHSTYTIISVGICVVCSENLSNIQKDFFSYLKIVCILLKSYASTILRYFPPCYRSPTGFIYSDNGVEFIYGYNVYKQKKSCVVPR